MKSLLFFSDIVKEDLSQVGGKGLSLGLMSQAGFLVPPGFVITTQVTKIDQVEEELLRAFDELGADRVAVRSSAVAEDSAEASWAGQFESYLDVAREGLLKAVQDCWKSVDDAKEYASTQDVSDDQLGLAVVVQTMVDSEIAGVVFSVNPINKDNNEIMIEAVHGLGEALVQGMVTPDNYVLTKDTDEVVSSQNADCLNDDQLTELKDLVMRIESFYGSPQDIEWAYAKGKFYIVQSRPITTL